MTVDPFDEKAATWDDDPTKVERAAAVAACIANEVPLDPSVRLLEYGAGTGLVTQALQASVGPVTLADTSSGMREVLRDKVGAGAIVNADIWALDLATDPVPDAQFDLIVTVLTLHHIVDLDTVFRGFVQLLAPGGYLCISDLDEEDGSFHSDGFGGHHGFARPALGRQLEQHGFVEVAFADCHHIVRDGVTYPMFLATARAPASDR